MIMVISTASLAVTNKVVLQIEGMSWPAWPLIVKKALEGLEGVEKASVSFLENRGEVSYDPEKVTEKEIVNKVNKIGFRAKVIEK